MSANKSQTSAYNIQYTSTKKQRDSPTSSILKTPTPIFLTTRNTSVRTRRLKFANGGDAGELLSDFREGSHDSASTTSTGELSDIQKINYDNTVNQNKFIEVALSPVKKMKVSPDSWNAFLEYQKYKDHSNETEKTDYTYSRLSKFRNKEIIPGFRIRPNLSRRPIRTGGSCEYLSTSWSPEANYCVKTTTYETTRSVGSAGKLDGFERDGNRRYQNEASEYGARYDGYSNDGETMKFDDNYQSYSTFGDDGMILRSRKGFGYGTAKSDKQSRLESEWGYDETDDDYITSTKGEDRSSWLAAGGKSALVFLTTVFATITNGFASALTPFKDLFSRYVLRRDAGGSPYRYGYVGNSWKTMPQTSPYSYGKYNTYNRGRLSNWWYQSFLYALYSKMVSAVTSTADYMRYKYNRSSRRGKLLWFLIPLLILFGLCVVLRDYIPNPDTILSYIINCVLSIWAVMSFAFLVLFPRFVFEIVPHFATVSVPFFLATTVPNWLSSVTLSNLVVDPLIYAAELIFNGFVGAYSLTSGYLLNFYTYFCVFAYKAFGLFNHVPHVFYYVFDVSKNALNYVLGY